MDTHSSNTATVNFELPTSNEIRMAGIGEQNANLKTQYKSKVDKAKD